MRLPSGNMRLLWISDSPDTPSGFGNVTRFVCEGLARRGYHVSILGWQTRELFNWNGCTVYPTAVDPMGSDALYAYLVRHRPDAVIALGDVWWLPYFAAPHVRRQMELTDTPWLLYFPIDGDTKEERLPSSWIELLHQVDVPIAMSRYGQRIVHACGIPCEYIPHGVDLDIFSPPPDRDTAKAHVGANGKFLVLSDSRNQPRKMLPRLLDIFARFAAGRPDALLHLHTDPDDEFTRSGYYSYDVRADVRHLGIESQVRFTPGLTMKHGGGIPLNELAAYYQAADIHLLASSGEGFGLPTLQAAATGAVAMAGAYSASHELLEGYGEAIAIEDWSETQFGIRRALIDVEDAVGKLAHYYDDRDLLRERSARARQFALAYGWDAVVDQWDQLLRSIGERRQRIHRSLYRTVASVDSIVQRAVPHIPGATVTVKVAQCEFGRLEAAIFADAGQHNCDVRLPVVPPPCEVARVRVARRPGYICVAPSDVPIFVELKRIFPMLQGWVPTMAAPCACCEDSLEIVSLQTVEDARLELVQSVLLLNVCRTLPEALLVDAALYGVLCIGTRAAAAQMVLWPELAIDDQPDALNLARALLTNAARATRLSAQARLACQRVYAPSEEDSARSLRRLYAAQRIDALTMVR